MMYVVVLSVGAAMVYPQLSEALWRCSASACYVLQTDSREKVVMLAARARAYNKRGEYEKAEYVYRATLIHDERFIPALTELADLLRHRGRYDEAETLFLKALAVDPENQWLYIDTGKLYRNMERYDDAFRMFEKAEQMDPTEPLLWSYGFSQYYKKIGDLEAAERTGLYAIELAPDDPFHHMSLGDVYTAREKYELAEQAYMRAIELDPNGEAYNGLGWLYLFQERLDEAKRWFESYNQHVARPRGEVELGLGFVAERTGDVAAAREFFERSAYLDPSLGGAAHAERLQNK